MAGDPFAIFREGTSRQETLKVIWPELYECLAGIGKHAKPRNLFCVIGDCVDVTTPRRARVPAAGRLTPNGHPACEKHLKLAEIPGGYPLARMTEDEIEFHRSQARRGR